MDENKNPNQVLPEAETKTGDGWGGDGCILFWGKFDNFCEVVGKIIVGIVTLGIAPLIVHLSRKKKEAK